MMTKPCADFLPALVDAAEGEIAPELTAHLPGCAGCRDELAALKAALLALAPPPASEPGPFLAASVRRAHEARRRPAARIWRRLRFVLPVLLPATAAALFVVFTETTSGPTEAQEVETAAFFDALAASADEGDENEAEVISAVLAETHLDLVDLFGDEMLDDALDETGLELDRILDEFPG